MLGISCTNALKKRGINEEIQDFPKSTDDLSEMSFPPKPFIYEDRESSLVPERFLTAQLLLRQEVFHQLDPVFFKASHWPSGHMTRSRPLIGQRPPRGGGRGLKKKGGGNN